MNAASAPRRDIKSRLRDGEHIRGLFIATRDATLCEFVALLGWDFLLLDAEHGAVAAADMENTARACERRGVTAGARVPLRAPSEIGRFLDAGAVAMMIPFVESALDAARAVELIKYPPQGLRGLGAPRRANFCLTDSIADEIARANRDTLVIVQIESLRGLDKLEEIAAVDGVDVLFLGPADLSLAVGAPMQWDAPAFVAAVDAVASVAARTGKKFGAYAGSRDRMLWYEARGACFMAAALEDLLMLGSEQLKPE
jgi:4-hydroxy-2-oxoheptanedioate aldolase